MKYLPFENFEIHTKLSSDEVFYRLHSIVDTERKWWIFTNKPFWGEVNRYYFEIWRATWWSYNITPVVIGNIQPKERGCYLQIRMRMPWIGFLFSSLIFGYMWFLFFLAHANLIVQKIKTGVWQFASLGEWLLSLVMFVVFLGLIYLMYVGTFKNEVRRVKNHLLKITETAKEDIVYRDTILGITEPQIIKALFVIPIVISFGWMIYKLLL